MATFVPMLMSLAGLSCACAQNAIEALTAAWQDRLNAADAAGSAALYTTDAALRHATSKVDRGRGEIEVWAAENIEAGLQFTVT